MNKKTHLVHPIHLIKHDLMGKSPTRKIAEHQLRKFRMMTMNVPGLNHNDDGNDETDCNETVLTAVAAVHTMFTK